LNTWWPSSIIASKCTAVYWFSSNGCNGKVKQVYKSAAISRRLLESKVQSHPMASKSDMASVAGA
jgi:hypothetical protein